MVSRAVSTQAMERRESPDVEQASKRLARPAARLALVLKRTADVVLALAMLVALLPVLLLVLGLLLFAGDGGWIEKRQRLGRNGRTFTLTRFRTLPGGAVGLWLERAGARDLPLLFAVLRGKLSFVGPRATAPGTGAGYTGPRRLMAPGLIGPAQRGLATAEAADRLDDAYVERWSLWADLRLLAGRPPKRAHHRVSKSNS
jgi:lipopolysaccharide/colanic/teichoic acid biosynthesis glycosyltransferase